MKIRFDSEKIITKMDDGSKECFCWEVCIQKYFNLDFIFLCYSLKSIEIMIPVRPSCKIIILTYFSQAELIWS